jgi:hypothetical protein
MLCLECGAEMRLAQVVEDTTMFVSGYEHHTWQCPACSTVEQRMTFPRQKTSTPTELLEPIQSVSAPPTQAAPPEPSEVTPTEPTAAMPAELTEAVPVEATQTKPVEPMQALPVEPSKTVLVEPTQLEPAHPDLPAAMVKTNAWAKALDERLRDLKERAAAARQTAGKTARPTQFNRDWDKKPRPLPPASGSSEAWSYVKPDEPFWSPTVPTASPAPTSHNDPVEAQRSATVPTASPAPTSHEEPVAPGSDAPAARKVRDRLGQLVRTVRRWEFSRGH